MAQKAMVMAAHLPYSPDLAPSDFYLFDHMNGLLGGASSETGESLLFRVANGSKVTETQINRFSKSSISGRQRQTRKNQIEQDSIRFDGRLSRKVELKRR
jgi:hypothetical protein